MELKDLLRLEIGLELYKLEEPLEGMCEEVISHLLTVVRHDILKLRAAERAQNSSRTYESSSSKEELVH